MLKIKKLKVAENESKVLLCKKGDEYRLSIIQKIGGKRTFEIIHVREKSEDFLKKIKEKLEGKQIKPFNKIQRISRFSKKMKKIVNVTGMEEVPDEIHYKVMRTLNYFSQPEALAV